MSVSATFGSVGDIISLGILIKDLCKALDRSSGSSAEYREIITELWALDDVLVQAELLWESHEVSNELDALRTTAGRTADQCRNTVGKFLEKVKKYGPSLREGGSRSTVKDAARKVQWQFCQSDELTKFRAEIIAHCSTMNVILATVGV